MQTGLALTGQSTEIRVDCPSCALPGVSFCILSLRYGDGLNRKSMSNQQGLFIGIARKAAALAVAASLLVPFLPLPASAEVELFGGNPLLDAIKAKDPRKAEAAIAGGEKIEVEDFDGRGPLIYASMIGSLDILELLIKRSVNVNHRDKLGNTALFYAAIQGEVEIAQALLEAGADKNKDNRQGITPLMAAAREGHTEVVQLLLAQGADPNRHDYTGRTALMWAEWNRKAAVARLLRQAGVRE